MIGSRFLLLVSTRVQKQIRYLFFKKNVFLFPFSVFSIIYLIIIYQGIHAVNLGDSGFIVVRDGCTTFKSPIQQHDFNFTYQLQSDNSSDLPSSAQVNKNRHFLFL